MKYGSKDMDSTLLVSVKVHFTIHGIAVMVKNIIKAYEVARSCAQTKKNNENLTLLYLNQQYFFGAHNTYDG